MAPVDGVADDGNGDDDSDDGNTATEGGDDAGLAPSAGGTTETEASAARQLAETTGVLPPEPPSQPADPPSPSLPSSPPSTTAPAPEPAPAAMLLTPPAQRATSRTGIVSVEERSFAPLSKRSYHHLAHPHEHVVLPPVQQLEGARWELVGVGTSPTRMYVVLPPLGRAAQGAPARVPEGGGGGGDAGAPPPGRAAAGGDGRAWASEGAALAPGRVAGALRVGGDDDGGLDSDGHRGRQLGGGWRQQQPQQQADEVQDEERQDDQGVRDWGGGEARPGSGFAQQQRRGWHEHQVEEDEDGEEVRSGSGSSLLAAPVRHGGSSRRLKAGRACAGAPAPGHQLGGQQQPDDALLLPQPALPGQLPDLLSGQRSAGGRADTTTAAGPRGGLPGSAGFSSGPTALSAALAAPAPAAGKHLQGYGVAVLPVAAGQVWGGAVGPTHTQAPGPTTGGESQQQQQYVHGSGARDNVVQPRAGIPQHARAQPAGRPSLLGCCFGCAR